MGSKLQKNAIITGHSNSYCLVCETYFETTEDINGHLLEDSHSNNLLACPYLERYGANNIRKVNKGYYCECCSLLLTTTTKVSMHVQEKSHHERKGTFLVILKKLGEPSAVVAFDDVLINERAWHSLADKTCLICNEEFDDEDNHKTESKHLLKLVLNKVEVGAGNNVYRETDESSFQCLTCNSIFFLNTLNEHFANPEHKKLYVKCQEDMKKYTEQQTMKESSVKSTKSDDKINEKDDEKLDANHNVTENHSEETVKTNDCNDIETSESKSDPEDESSYASENNFIYNHSSSYAFCRTCRIKLPATLRSMKEHVTGKDHTRKLRRASNRLQAAKSK